MEWHVMIWLVKYVMYVCACVCLHVCSYVHVFLYICKQILFSLVYRYVHMHVHAFSVCVCTWAVDISKHNEVQQSCMTEWNYRQGQLSTPQTRSWDPSQVEGMGTRNSCRCGSPNSGLQRSAIWWSLSERVSSCALGVGLSCRLMSPKNWLQPSLVTLVLVRFPSPSLNSHHNVCHRGQLLCKTEEKLSFSSMISIYWGYFIVARHVWWHHRVQNFSRRVPAWLRMIR